MFVLPFVVNKDVYYILAMTIW